MPPQSTWVHFTITLSRSQLKGKSPPLFGIRFMLDLIFMPFTMQFPLSSKYSDLLLTTITFSFWYQTLDMTDKRGATMAELPWPTLNRGESTSRPMGSSDSDMGDDIGHETFAPPAPTIPAATTPAPSSNLAPPPSTSLYNRHQDYAHYGPWTSSTTPGWQLPSIANPRERTVHTIYFKIWDPDSPSRSLYIQEINRQGIVRQIRSRTFLPQAYWKPSPGQPDVRLLALSLWYSSCTWWYSTSSYMGAFDIESYTCPTDRTGRGETSRYTPFWCPSSWQIDRFGTSISGNSPETQRDQHVEHEQHAGAPSPTASGLPSWTEYYVLINNMWPVAPDSNLSPAPHFFRKKAPLDGVCVCVWNIWTDVKLQFNIKFAGGGSRVQSLPPTKTLWSPWWYMAWSAMRTCHFPIFPSMATG